MNPRPFRSRMASVALAAALAALAPASARALHASDPCPADPGPLELACGPTYYLGVNIGHLTGSGSEFAFDYPLGQKVTLSELTWDLRSVTVAGVQGSAGLGRRFRLNLGVWWAVDSGDGTMVDRDWSYAPEVSAVIVAGDDNWTDESHHPDMTVDAGTMIDANLTALALQTGPLSVHGILGYKRDFWRWSARGGTYVYTFNDFRDSAGSFDSGQEVITYEQLFTIPYAGLEVSWRKPKFAVDTHLLLSPFVTASDSDYHVLRDTLFEGDFFGGTFVGLGLNATWAFARHWSATLGLEYQSVSRITGDMTISGPGVQGVFGAGGGVALHTAMATLGAGYRF